MPHDPYEVSGLPDSVSMKILRHIPRPVAENPERVLVNFACIFMGIAGLAKVQPGSLLALWPLWVSYSWSATMLVGGSCGLLGYWRGKLPVQRLGMMLIALACFTYGFALIVVFSGTGLFPALIFIALGLAKIVRLLVTSVYRASVAYRSEEQHRLTGEE